MVARKKRFAGGRYLVKRRGGDVAPRQRFHDAPRAEQTAKFRCELLRFHTQLCRKLRCHRQRSFQLHKRLLHAISRRAALFDPERLDHGRHIALVAYGGVVKDDATAYSFKR